MRLTLRTLLAYLDDRLAPANARELGLKLKQSPFAQELAERIKDVVRRRRLARDENTRTIDANLIAEYLDDQLTPELITLIEKEVLASDQSLAEVAATHQILGLLADPVELSAQLRQRLYQLDPTVDDVESVVTPAEQRPADWQPLPKQTSQSRRSPMVILVSMVLGWLVLLATDSDLFGTAGDDEVIADNGPDDAENQRADNAAGTTPDNEATRIAQAEPDQTPQAAGNDDNTTLETPTTPETSGKGDTDAASIERGPVPMNSDGEVTIAQGNTGVSEAESGGTRSDGEAQPAVASLPHIELIDTDNIASLFALESEVWTRASAAKIPPATSWTKHLNGQLICVPEPFTARLLAPEMGWDLQLVGPCVALVDGVGGKVRIVDGRGLLRKYEGAESADFELTTNGGNILIDVPESPAAVAIGCGPRVNGATPEGDSRYPVSGHSLVQICAYEGDVTLGLLNSDGTMPESSDVTIPKESVLMWDSSAGHKPESRQRGTLLPDWVAAEAGEPDPLVAHVRASALQIYTDAESSSAAVVTFLKERNPQLSGFGVSHVILDRDVERLATTLLSSDQESTRVGSVNGIQKLLAESSVFEQRLVSTLETRLPEMELGNAMKLIRGVTPVAAEDPEISAWLLELLRNQRPAMRELAILNLERLTGERYGFFAGDDATRRDASLRRWRKHIERNEGMVLKSGQ